MKLRLLALAFGVALVAAGFGVFAYVALDFGDKQPERQFAIEPTIVPTPPPTPTVVPTPASTAPVARLQVPAIGIDASMQIIGVDPDGTMQSPKGPKDVGWYTFAARPGYVGNTVFSGHVDYINYGPAVFWRLRDLKGGDEIVVMLQDGASFKYRVVNITAYDEATAPVAEIVGPTQTEVITLITCTGTFSRASHDYDKRLVVRGERVVG